METGESAIDYEEIAKQEHLSGNGKKKFFF